MPKYYYTQTVVYELTVEAATEEAADAVAVSKDIADAGVEMLTRSGWEEDGMDYDD